MGMNKDCIGRIAPGFVIWHLSQCIRHLPILQAHITLPIWRLVATVA